MDENLDLASQYQIPLQKGVPALAVLNDKGKLLHSQQSGEFAPMGRMDPSAVTTFPDAVEGGESRLLGGDDQLLDEPASGCRCFTQSAPNAWSSSRCIECGGRR